MNGRSKQTIVGIMVKPLYHRRTDRGMNLIEFETRCVHEGEIHELVTTTESPLGAGDRINPVGFVGFIEIIRAGVIGRGDVVYCEDQKVGTVIGFDDCHYPNHYNIIIHTNDLSTANELKANTGSIFLFIDQITDVHLPVECSISGDSGS